MLTVAFSERPGAGVEAFFFVFAFFGSFFVRAAGDFDRRVETMIAATGTEGQTNMEAPRLLMMLTRLAA